LGAFLPRYRGLILQWYHCLLKRAFHPWFHGIFSPISSLLNPPLQRKPYPSREIHSRYKAVKKGGYLGVFLPRYRGIILQWYHCLLKHAFYPWFHGIFSPIPPFFNPLLPETFWKGLTKKKRTLPEFQITIHPSNEEGHFMNPNIKNPSLFFLFLGLFLGGPKKRVKRKVGGGIKEGNLRKENTNTPSKIADNSN
jgi:hypothetical protein